MLHYSYFILPPVETKRDTRFHAQGSLWLAWGAVNCPRAIGAHMWHNKGHCGAVRGALHEIFNGQNLNLVETKRDTGFPIFLVLYASCHRMPPSVLYHAHPPQGRGGGGGGESVLPRDFLGIPGSRALQPCSFPIQEPQSSLMSIWLLG